MGAALALVLANVQAQRARSSMFVFQNNFWLNLHQFLRGEIYRRGVKIPLGIDPTSLNDSDRSAWASAIDVYTNVAKTDLVFDEAARRIANALATTGDLPRLPDGLIDVATTDALNAAAPIYRARLWPARQRDNDVWNASAKVLVDGHETAMATALANAYHITWPGDPFLVDAVGEIGPNSAVTHDGPPGFAAHIQAGAASARNTGDALLVRDAR
jgi:hypothetical protein